MLEAIRLQFFFAIFYFARAKLTQVILWQRRSRRACSHGCCDFWQMNIQESLRLFQVNHCFDAHHTCYVLHYFKFPPLLADILADIFLNMFLTSLPRHSLWTSFRHINIFWHSWHIFDHSFWHILSELLANISSDILSDLSCDILQLLLWHTLSATTTNPFHHSWGPARHTELAWSQLGSGTPHWTRRIAVEVWHTTLNSRDHSWGPARHTELAGSRLGSGTPHWTRRIAVGVRHATLNSRARDRRRRRKEEEEYGRRRRRD